MKITRSTTDSERTGMQAALCIASVAVFLTVGGCASGPSNVPAKIAVPADVRLLAYGAYPLPAFMPPRAGGTLYIFDDEAGRVVAVTSYADLPAEGTGPESLLDVPGMKDSLDPKHHFRVYYSTIAPAPPPAMMPPAVAAAPATTQAEPQAVVSAPATGPSTEPAASQPATEPAALPPTTEPTALPPATEPTKP